MIETKKITKSYGCGESKTDVLRDIDLKIADGDFTVILGASGTVYQYGLLKLMVSVVFADVGNMPQYSFDFKALIVTLVLFVITYELVMYLYSRSIKRLSVKSVMLE